MLKAGNALWCTDCLLSRGGEKGGRKKKKNATQRKGKKEAPSPLDPDDIWLCMTCGNPDAFRAPCAIIHLNLQDADARPGGTRRTIRSAAQSTHWLCNKLRNAAGATCATRRYYACIAFILIVAPQIIVPDRTPNCPYEKVRAVADLLRSVGVASGGKKKGRHQEEEESIQDPEPASSEPLFFHKNAPGLRGLKNLGNTCFFNSVMQNLAHSSVRVHLLFLGARLTVVIGAAARRGSSGASGQLRPALGGVLTLSVTDGGTRRGFPRVTRKSFPGSDSQGPALQGHAAAGLSRVVSLSDRWC